MYLIGYIRKPHGIKGELKIEPVSPDPARFKLLQKIYVQSEELKKYPVEHVRLINRLFVIKLAGINTRNQAEILRDAEVLIPEQDLIELNDNEYFIHDLVGCGVIDEQGASVGELIGIMQNAANDVYVLRTSGNREILIPAIRDVIRKIDLERKLITIRVQEGLLD